MKKIIGVLCVTLFAAFSTTTAANAKVCENEVFATGKASLTKVPGAYLSSLWAWRREAQDRYGKKFRAWRNADRKNIDCAKGVKDGKKGWICTRTANPCRLGGETAGTGGGGDGIILPKVTLREGDQGDDVRTLQDAMNALGYNLVVDGNYGSGTVAAVENFQRKEGIGVDGSVGPKTRARLEQALASS